MTSGYDLVRVTLGQITHSARQDASDGWGFTACGRPTHRDRDKIYDGGSVRIGVAPNVDCMSCFVHEAKAGT